MSILLLLPRRSLFEANAHQTLSRTDRNLKRVKYTQCVKERFFGRKVFPTHRSLKSFYLER